MIRLLVVDDHKIIREGLRMILADYPDLELAGEAADADAGLRRMLKEEWDVVLLDLSMPGRPVLEVIERVKLAKPALPILILTMHDNQQLAMRLLKAGADGFLVKDCDPDELVGAIRRVARGRKFLTQDQAELLLADRREGGDEKRPHERLSNREYVVMQRLARGIAIAAIARELSITPQTVSTYRRRIMEKMNLHSNVDIAVYVREEGLEF